MGRWTEGGERANVTSRGGEGRGREEEIPGLACSPWDRFNQKDWEWDSKEEAIGSLCQPEPQSSALTLCLFTLAVIFKVFWTRPLGWAQLPSSVITSAPVTWCNWRPGDIWKRVDAGWRGEKEGEDDEKGRCIRDRAVWERKCINIGSTSPSVFGRMLLLLVSSTAH